MAKNQVSFFATRSDLERLLQGVQAKAPRPLAFVAAGLFDSPEAGARSLSSDADAASAEVARVPDPGYIVGPIDLSIEARAIPQHRGGVKYAVDQLANPKTVAFRPGGRGGDKVLLSGQMGTTSEDPDSLALLRIFSKELRGQFSNVKAFMVGKEAGELLDQGWRLTANPMSPPSYDLVRK